MIVEFRQVSAFSEKVHRPVESLSCLHRRSTVPSPCLRCELDSRPFQSGEESSSIRVQFEFNSSSIRVHSGFSAKSRQYDSKISAPSSPLHITTLNRLQIADLRVAKVVQMRAETIFLNYAKCSRPSRCKGMIIFRGDEMFGRFFRKSQ